MYAQVEKPKENKSRSVANAVAQNKSNGRQGFGFVDNRQKMILHNNRILSPDDVVQGRFWEQKADGSTVWHHGPVLRGLWKEKTDLMTGQQDYKNGFGIWERKNQSGWEDVKSQAGYAKEGVKTGAKAIGSGLWWLGSKTATFLDSLLPNPYRIVKNWSVESNSTNLEKDDAGTELKYEIDKIKSFVPLFVGYVTELGVEAVKTIFEKISKGEIKISGVEVQQTQQQETGPDWKAIAILVAATSMYIANIIEARRAKITPTDAERNRDKKLEVRGGLGIEKKQQ